MAPIERVYRIRRIGCGPCVWVIERMRWWGWQTLRNRAFWTPGEGRQACWEIVRMAKLRRLGFEDRAGVLVGRKCDPAPPGAPAPLRVRSRGYRGPVEPIAPGRLERIDRLDRADQVEGP